MSERIDRATFCRAYVPMAKAGKSALEIAVALGVDKPSDEEKSQFVSQKASNYRKELRAAALKAAEKQGLDEAATKELVESAAAKLPKLSVRTRTVENFSAFLDELLAECDAEEGDESPDEEGTEETTETPE